MPATEKTKGMVGAESIAQMKPGAVILNFARDTLVDEKALASALENGVVKLGPVRAEESYIPFAKPAKKVTAKKAVKVKVKKKKA